MNDSAESVCRALSPENADITLHPAGAVVRSRAYLTDLAIRALLLMAIGTISSILAQISLQIALGFFLIGFFWLVWLYYVTFEIWWHGQSPGKKAFGLRTVLDDGTPVTPAASLVRNLMRTVDMLPLGYGGGILCMLLHPQFKRGGDILSGSLVVHDDPYRYRQHFDILARLRRKNPAPAENTLPEMPSLSFSERECVKNFAVRCRHLPPAHAESLAQELAEVYPQLTAAECVNMLKQWAQQCRQQDAAS